MRLLNWCPLIIAATNGRAGYDLDLYGAFWWFDILQHSMFFFALGLLLLRYSSNVAFVGTIGLSLGALWEIVEWAYYTGWFHNRWDALDTGKDLCVDLIGLAVAVAMTYYAQHYNECSALSSGEL